MPSSNTSTAPATSPLATLLCALAKVASDTEQCPDTRLTCSCILKDYLAAEVDILRETQSQL